MLKRIIADAKEENNPRAFARGLFMFLDTTVRDSEKGVVLNYFQ